MEIVYFIIFSIFFFALGFLLGRRRKASGRLVINEEADEYMVAITEKPENLKYKKAIVLKVFVAKRGV